MEEEEGEEVADVYEASRRDEECEGEGKDCSNESCMKRYTSRTLHSFTRVKYRGETCLFGVHVIALFLVAAAADNCAGLRG